MGTKTALIDDIVAVQMSDGETDRVAKQMQPMVQMMLGMAGGNPADAPTLAKRLAAKLTPFAVQTARDKYAEIFTEEQLEKLAAFLQANPWYFELNARFKEATQAALQEAVTPALQEVFKTYIPAAA